MAENSSAPGNLARFGLKIAAVCSVYLLVQAGVLLATGTGWQKFWVLQPIDQFDYNDAIHYANLAVNPGCSAFYPLWPGLVRWLVSPATAAEALKVALPGSEVIFLASLPLALWTFERILRHRAAALVVLVLYALGPNAIFQSIGYTESLFGVLSLLFLLCLHEVEQSPLSQAKTVGLYTAVFGLSALLNLLRPALVQSWFAIAFTLSMLLLMQRLSLISPGRWGLPTRQLILASLIGAGSLVGYGVVGLTCLNTVGDFFGPFHAQVTWGRSLALRPWLLVLPRSLLFDLHGLYTPMLVFAALGWIIYGAYRQRELLTLSLPRQPWLYSLLVHPLAFIGAMAGLGHFGKARLTALPTSSPTAMLQLVGRFSVLYAIAFSGVHSIINFLANSGYLYSTSRHYFGTPFAFVGIGAMLAVLTLPALNRLMWVLAAVGLFLLAQQWVSFSASLWLG
ncbi:hypothetical protein IQ254_08005 [Nodosilinea sp. LEGE 07088]|uniref:hypothetical protein n=1 Tax=Nodosilinea sp. LEGE 07088 TaxID=2777968 RepID=UPI0018824CB6|nr:hypothetical protein [Nodosilinea sp. LEGE 07088]MBE9137146.1 hypothetical protein [Nodosilinea sp. LEGE 07088]